MLEKPRIRLRAGVTIEPSTETRADLLEAPGGGIVLRVGPRKVYSALRRGRLDSADGAAPVMYILDRLRSLNLVEYEFRLSGGGSIRLLPLPDAPDFLAEAAEPPPYCRMSRFACLRRQGEDWVLDSPLARAQAVLDRRACATLLAALDPPRSRRPARQRKLLAILFAAGLLEPSDCPEPLALAAWEFHDLLFHQRSRAGQARETPGPASPAQPRAGEAGRKRIALPVPDLARLRRNDPPFQDVLERRRSARQGSAPLDIRGLGEFLYRAAHVREPGGCPWPSAGGIYPLEIYLAVDRCAGIGRGLYHYDVRSHSLLRIAPAGKPLGEMLRRAAAATASDDPPAVLFTLTARLGEVSARYRDMAYRLVLLDAGALIQTLYLAGAAMSVTRPGLTACALGSGDGRLFAAISGTDPFSEPAVAEFALRCLASNSPPR